MAFHEFHGRNIVLSENNTVAYRKSGYAHGITFSKAPLLPGEIFLIEIEKCEHGWTGNLRCGLIQKNPSTKFCLPQCALPNLVVEGESWILPISTADLSLFDRTFVNKLYPVIYESNNCLHTSKGSIPTSILQPSRHKLLNMSISDVENSENSFSTFFAEHFPDNPEVNGLLIYPAVVGSRIGVTYVLRDNLADMYMFLNGDIFGPCATGIPIKKGPIYAVIELYGTTKKVRIIQTSGISSLKKACRDKILQQVSHKKVFNLPLPKKLIEFLNYETQYEHFV